MSAAMQPVATAAPITRDTVLPAPLTPIQRWFMARDLPQSRHYNQAIAFEAAEPLDLVRLEAALTAVADAHPALRLAIESADGAWRQRSMPTGMGVPLSWFDLKTLRPSFREQMARQKAGELQNSFD